MTMQKVEIVLLSIVGLLAVATAKPQLGLGFLTFKDGNIGVNWGGYHAEAGLGGLLTGGNAAGGLHASAGTPNGPSARAGLGGLLDGNGYTGGQLYADAGVGGGGPKAGARIGGELSGHGAHGGSFAGADTGIGGPAVVKSVETHSFGAVQPSVVGKTVETVHHSAPSVDIVKTVDTHVSDTVPNFARRTVEISESIPSHVSAVQTETFEPAPANLLTVKHVEKVKTHVTPKKIKTTLSTVVKSRVSPGIQSGVVVEKAIYPAPTWNFRQHYYSNAAPVAYGASAGISGNAGSYGGFGGYGGGFGSGYGGGYGNNYYVKHQPNPQFYDDVFNIPISTLTAVNQLLRNKGK